jgi:trk system potassium uptake protein TrkH
VKLFGPDLLEEVLLPAPRSLIRRLGGIQLFVISFLGLILVGTLGLLVLPGLYVGERLGVLDALFMATSAVCVTGLVVVDTATHFTPLGQAWILALIQAGGLGIVTFTTLIITMLGRRRSLRLEDATGGAGSLLRHVDSAGLIRSIVALTLFLEALGATFLWVLWQGEMGPLGALWPAIFHAVSAFCNAGFGTFSDSLVPFRDSPLTLLVVSALIIGGGLGFVVLEDVRGWIAARKQYRLTTHTRLVLVSTALLLAIGWLLFALFEWHNQLAGLTLVERLVNAFHMSVTPRTAGFNSVDYAQVSNPSLFLTIVLMVIGGSPGSTAGGVKTVTAAVLVLLFLTRMRGDRSVHAFERTIPQATVQRAGSLAIGGLVILGGAVFLLLVSETAMDPAGDRDLLIRLVFEAHSAFGTVGLSMGSTTRDLSHGGKLVIIALMFLGRVGPAAVVASMFAASMRQQARFRYGEEDVNLA